jgi:hypothetical protein
MGVGARDPHLHERTGRAMKWELRDRVPYAFAYRFMLPTIRRTIRVLPTSAVRRLRDRAEMREASATYMHTMDETDRVGILRRMAVDRFDVRSDATYIYLRELRRRSGREQ